MGEPENRRQRGLMRDALAGWIDEEIVAAYYFLRHKAWEDDWRKGPWALKRLLRTSDHPADRVARMNVLALTPAHLVVFTARAKAPLLVVRAPLVAWPLDAVSIASRGKAVTATSIRSDGSSQRWDNRIIRATLSVAGDDRPLIMDFPNHDLSRELIAAVKAATGDTPRPG